MEHQVYPRAEDEAIRPLRAHDHPMSVVPFKVRVITDLLSESLDKASAAYAEAQKMCWGDRECHLTTEFVILKAVVSACVTMLREEIARVSQ